ncbi:hypothetical protein [Bacillus thuringiensis]|uniref:hypothetical protein n=1 Tax=Bacillus thuringiensis TaxID=1428 RepID=UPI000BFE3526|nr:hypothetical protein [Bacillus thuringiensis]PGT90039.1 hypothetical protein COD17_09830 [Bacillus thuringiensis]
MVDYDTYETVRDALRCLSDYFEGGSVETVYLLIDKRLGDASISGTPLVVIEDWLDDYGKELTCIEHFEVYEYKKGTMDAIQKPVSGEWKTSGVKGYIRRKVKVNVHVEFTLS